MHVDGSCLCGHITYRAEVDPDRAAICHCADCQANSGTAYGYVVGVVDNRFELLTGKLKHFDKVAESGRVRRLGFCPECGTRIYARTDDDPSAFFGLRAGTVRQRDQLVPKYQVWTRSAQPWVFDLSAIPARDRQG